MEGTHGPNLPVILAPDGDSSYSSGHRKSIEDQLKPEPKSWKPDKGQGEKGIKPTEDEYLEKYKEGEDPVVHKGKQGKPGAQPSFVLPCRAYLEQRCRFGSKCKYSHSSITSLSDDDYHHFIRMACPLADERDVEFLWSLSKSDRLDVVNECKTANVDDIKSCCVGRISRAKWFKAH